MSLIAQLAVPSLKRVLAIEDERARQLDAIQQTVQAHLEGPYQTALDYLRRADLPDVPAQRRAEHLRMAEERFMDALGNFKATEPLQRSWAGIYLAGICVLGKRVAEARRYALEAHADAVKATSKECAAVNERLQAKVTRRVKLLSQSDAAQTGWLGAAGVGGLIAAAAGMTIASPVTVPLAAGGLAVGGSAYAYRTYVRRQSRARLEELAAFVDHVADLAHGLGAVDVARRVLSVDGTGLFVFDSAPARALR
jgi:hypothetical protein